MPQFRESVGLIERIQALARKGGFRALETVSTPDYVTAASMAAAGIGLVLAPSSLRRLDVPNLRFAEIRDYSTQVTLMMAHRVGLPPSLAQGIDKALPLLEVG